MAQLCLEYCLPDSREQPKKGTFFGQSGFFVQKTSFFQSGQLLDRELNVFLQMSVTGSANRFVPFLGQVARHVFIRNASKQLYVRAKNPNCSGGANREKLVSRVNGSAMRVREKKTDKKGHLSGAYTPRSDQQKNIGGGSCKTMPIWSSLC
jgi:hypothetical protein